MNIVNEIREKQNQLIVMINTTFDEIIKQVETIKTQGFDYEAEYESIYPLTNTTGFKGKKPIAVKLGDNRIITPTWKKVVETILKEVLKDEKMKQEVFKLSDRLLGRVRKRVSTDSEGMRSPLEISKGLYIETHYDTETLINLLIQILNEISYDYNNIRIIIKNK